jgi:hypothetical protein
MRFNLAGSVFLIGGLVSVSAVHAEQAVAIAPNNTLLLFDTATPGTTTARAVTGLGASETIRGIDYRPGAGELQATTFASGSAANSTIKTYRIDATTGAATLIATIPGIIPGAADVPTGYDFNPAIDRIRFANSIDENARINPNSGALAGDDPNLTPAATTTVIALAYDRNSPGTPGVSITTVYVIDRNDSMLGIMGGIDSSPTPNGGVVTDLCPLGFTLHPTNDGGLDISPSGVAYAALTDNATGLTGLYTLTLPTAVSAASCATFIGIISTGSIQIYSLTILPPDSDGDGVRDPLDGCPGDPAKTAAGICGCGAADTDSDSDGTPDCNDGCPNDAAKIAAGGCGCGAPDTDSDADGTTDCIDGCPNDPAKAAPGACGCGLADADADGNGVADCNDSPVGPACGACGPSASAVALSLLGLCALGRARVRMRPT